MASHRTVLLAVCEPALQDSLGFALRRRGYHVLSALDGDRAAELSGRHLPDVAVVELLLPGRSGFQVAQLLKERSDGRVPMLMLAKFGAAAQQDYAASLGIERFLTLPVLPRSITASVEDLCPLPPASRLMGSEFIPWATAIPT